MDPASNRKTNLLVANCPRCPATNMTFDVEAQLFTHREYRWKTWHEIFAICRNCHKSTTFVVALSTSGYDGEIGQRLSDQPSYILQLGITLNDRYEIKGYVSLKGRQAVSAPQFTPEAVAKCFNEGAKCRSIGCFNAAATMFRLSLDLATRPLLPNPDDTAVLQPNQKQRRDLGLRVPWLIEQGRLPGELKALAECIREDGNDGAHAGDLSDADADDLMDFAEALYERLYSEPERLRLAGERRKARREGRAAQ